MDNKLQLFEFNSQPVRVVWVSNEPMPILADACKILEIGNPSDVVKRLLFPKGVDSIEVLTKGGRQMCTCISFPNYLDFVARSDKPNAIPFHKKQVGDKVQFGIAILGKERVIQRVFWGADHTI